MTVLEIGQKFKRSSTTTKVTQNFASGSTLSSSIQADDKAIFYHFPKGL